MMKRLVVKQQIYDEELRTMDNVARVDVSKFQHRLENRKLIRLFVDGLLPQHDYRFSDAGS